MKQTFGLIFISLFLAIPVAAQDKTLCELKLNQSPALLNLRLGMTPDEVKTIFGRAIKIKIKKKGNRVFFQNFIEKPAPPVLNGVRAVYLRFFEGRLYQIEFFYENQSGIKTIEEFTRSLTANLNLPDLWESVQGREVLQCDGFTLAADYVLNPRIELTDVGTLVKAEEFLAKENSKNK